MEPRACASSQGSSRHVSLVLRAVNMTHVERVAEFWCNVLVERGFRGSAARRDTIVAFLVENRFTKLTHLREADHPREWKGAEALEPGELEAVWDIRLAARCRSRWVGRCACCGCMPAHKHVLQVQAPEEATLRCKRFGAVGAAEAAQHNLGWDGSHGSNAGSPALDPVGPGAPRMA